MCETCAKVAPHVQDRTELHRQALQRKPEKTGLQQTGANRSKTDPLTAGEQQIPLMSPRETPSTLASLSPLPFAPAPYMCETCANRFLPLLAASIRIRLGSWIGGWRGVSVSWIRSLKGVLFLCIRHVLYEPDELETRKPRQTRGFSGSLQTTNFYELLRTIGGPGRQPGWERAEGSEGKPMMDASRSAPSRRRSSEVFT